MLAFKKSKYSIFPLFNIILSSLVFNTKLNKKNIVAKQCLIPFIQFFYPIHRQKAMLSFLVINFLFLQPIHLFFQLSNLVAFQKLFIQLLCHFRQQNLDCRFRPQQEQALKHALVLLFPFVPFQVFVFLLIQPKQHRKDE